MTRVRADALRCPRFRKAGEPFTDRNPSNLASMRAATRRERAGLTAAAKPTNGSFRLRVANGKHGFESRTGFVR